MNRTHTFIQVGLRAGKWLAAAAVLSTLGACASMNTVTSEVTAFNKWPEGRPPGTYAFEVLPSQAKNQATHDLEAAARPALEAAGFKPVAPGEKPDVLVNLGARVSVNDPSPFDDPLWVHGGVYRRHPGFGPAYGPWWGRGLPPGTYVRTDTLTFEREVGILLRDRATAEPLYEVRATTDGMSSNIKPYLTAMFAAALQEFPSKAEGARKVSIPLPK
jgi:hypothetical protein